MKIKPFLIIQLRPEDETSNSEFNAILRAGELLKDNVVRIRAERKGIPKLNLNDYSGIIVGGSPFDITAPETEKTEIQKTLESDFTKLFDKIVANDFPLIGVCSGNGLLGNYCGAPISKKYREPVGGVDITLTEEGQKDKLLSGLPTTFRALVGHKEACEAAPAEATLLASSSTCPIQMFRLGENVYATQFHPEADQNEFILRINVYKHHGYFPAEDAQKLIDAVKDEEISVPSNILKRFVDTYRTGV